MNRENDGMINSYSPNLAIPHWTYDILNVSAAGIQGSIRPYRNDFGLVSESEVKSPSISIAGGVELSNGHIGANIVPTIAENISSYWKEGKDALDSFLFNKIPEDNEIPPVSYSFVGDRNYLNQDLYSKTGGDNAVNLKIDASLLGTKLVNNKEGYPADLTSPFGQKLDINTKRNVTPFLNQEILLNDTSLLQEFNIQYYDASNNLVSLERGQFPDHHIAGYVITDENGLRYTFGLPVYNHVQEEYTFSTDSNRTIDELFTNVDSTSGGPNYNVPGTKKYYKKTEVPQYAYSYLLTSIQGNNYVDVSGDGITSDDLGYWVKFSYQKITTETTRYKWRDPFIKAHFIEGYATDTRDDMGTFTYGEKEVYYLKQAETKSHVAKFELNTDLRSDGIGACSRFQDDIQLGMKLRNLKEVILYTRAGGENNPLKKVKFQYDNSLTSNLPNSSSGGGKLTLKSLIIENGGSTLGNQNPYTFQYSDFNPAYSQYSKDRWGNYKPLPSAGESNIKWPYVTQNDSNSQDLYASAWNLTKIKLPTGTEISVDYEADRYAFVQNERAGEIHHFTMAGTESGNRLIYSYNPESTAPKVRFPLNEPISGTLSANDQKKEVLKYIDTESKEVYVKLNVNLRKSQEKLFETIEGYLKVKLDAPMTLISDGNGNYTQGEFELEKINNIHPFAALAYQHIELNQPWIANVTKNFSSASSNSEKLSLIKGLSSIVGTINQTFSNFENYCKQRQWGQEINLKLSGVRLKNVDGEKFGGGHRVRQITIHDRWNYDGEGYYGQVYDYTQQEKGLTMSSGVSSFEPFVGNDENSLKKSKAYVEVRKLKSNANLYYEYPINESLYPYPVVGYSEVKVFSLPAAKKAGMEVLGNAIFPEGTQATYGTTGMQKHTFYTARDFPVIPLETEMKKITNNYALAPNPLLNVQVNNLTASQGYGIILNDMHGKPKSEEAYSQALNGEIIEEPISWTKYNYKSDIKIERRKKVSKLNSLFSTMGSRLISLISEQEPTEEDIYFGYQSDFVVDVREIYDNTSSVGIGANVDIVFAFIPIPIPSKFNSATRVENRLKTVVTNKVIFQQGILESVESSNLGSKILTETLRWDLVTGQAVLQTLNNNFEAPVYHLNVPAYHNFVGMGPASGNSGVKFSIPNFAESSDKPEEFVFRPSFGYTSILRQGDEVLLYQNVDGLSIPLTKAIYVGVVNGDMRLYSPHVDLETYPNLEAKIVRSGNRNILSATSKSIKSLKIPETGGMVTHSKTVLLPVPQKL